ncbi:dynactin subunit p22 [Nitzschia inconspicua]|uniref:Dynactin subunit p22 n=1 Tax=Nitzschia inconspicua TaxID=303405 RepID=A0A9K3KVU8_9STRA|nr:dynactin subunit p22 [Nitzschia inconspicua]
MSSNTPVLESIPPSSASLESRLAALEAKVGRISSISSPQLSVQELSSRLDSLQANIDSHTTVAFRDTWQESLKLLKELDPDIALTHQQQPLLYKRQQVLAAASQLQCDMHQLDVILKLLTNETKETASTAGSTTMRLDQVTQAPIVTSPYYTQSLKDQERLDALRLTFASLNDRVSKLQQQMQQLLESYHTVMTAASEKFILAEEKAKSR